MNDFLLSLWSKRIAITPSRWKVIGYILTTLAILYLLNLLLLGGLSLSQFNWWAYESVLAPIMAAYLIALLSQFIVWARMISYSHRVGWRDVEIYCRMILIRTLPGGPWHWIGRISMYAGSTQVPSRVILSGNFLEWLLMLLVGASIASLLTQDLLFWVRMILATLILTLALGLAMHWQPRRLHYVRRFIEATFWLILFGSSWVAAGLILCLSVQAAGGYLDWVESTRISALAGILNLLITFLPTTLGIREITIIWFLQPYVALPIAIVVALSIRVIYTLADIIWGISGWLFTRYVFHPIPPLPDNNQE